jgi:hypothetical protein
MKMASRTQSVTASALPECVLDAITLMLSGSYYGRNTAVKEGIRASLRGPGGFDLVSLSHSH